MLCYARLLPPSDPRHVPAAERGFETAQLHTRKWTIAKHDGTVDEVRGAGVVGRYPVLREGGWREDTQSGGGHVNVSPRHIRKGRQEEGVFVYQSMSGPEVSFGGEIFFVPGTLREPVGDEFAVVVPSFPLANGADDYVF